MGSLVLQEPGAMHVIRQVAQRQGWGEALEEGESLDEVNRRVVEQREVTKAALETTFGPNWVLTLETINEAANLKDPPSLPPLDPAELNAAWSAARAAGRAERRGLAMAAAWSTALSAAWSASWSAKGENAAKDPQWKAARVSAGRSASVSVIQDLVGQHGFTQAHYDLITGQG